MKHTSLCPRNIIRPISKIAMGLMACCVFSSVGIAQQTKDVTHLSDHLAVHKGPINVDIIRDGDKALLIDCGNERVADVLTDLGITKVEQILFTHHHRDQVCNIGRLATEQTQIGVPATERDLFDNVASYWNNPKNRWHTYNFRPYHLILTEPVRVDTVFDDGASFTWGPAKIDVLATPGHTNGSLSYVVHVDGKRVAFCGDAIYDEGRLWDLYSLQKGPLRGNQRMRDYHGFLGARMELVQSLRRLRETKPDILIPSHGQVMTDPAKAINLLIKRLDLCYDRYVAISALRHYAPEVFAEYAGRKNHMSFATKKPAPSCLRHHGTTWALVSQNKAAFVIDYGHSKAVEGIKQLVDQGEIERIEGLWITHYHDDHVDFIPEFQRTFDCPCITVGPVADVVTRPLAWKLPCISPHKARVDRVPAHGESWTWHEFTMTAYHFPGQTFYHAGLLVEGRGLRMFFAGDSFSPTGIDDYCTFNRNWLGKNVGFDRCIRLLEKIKPTYIINCHINDAFEFTAEQYRFMRDNLAQREKLFSQLVPWDHANYGMDGSWVRCDPYEQHTQAGRTVPLDVVVTNHSAQDRIVACRAVLPTRWTQHDNVPHATPNKPSAGSTTWTKTTAPAKADAKMTLKLDIPEHVPPGRYVIPIDVRYGSWNLPQFTEAIIVLQSHNP